MSNLHSIELQLALAEFDKIINKLDYSDVNTFLATIKTQYNQTTNESLNYFGNADIPTKLSGKVCLTCGQTKQ